MPESPIFTKRRRATARGVIRRSVSVCVTRWQGWISVPG